MTEITRDLLKLEDFAAFEEDIANITKNLSSDNREKIFIEDQLKALKEIMPILRSPQDFSGIEIERRANIYLLNKQAGELGYVISKNLEKMLYDNVGIVEVKEGNQSEIMPE
jgi:hypothetical protein